MVVSLWASSSSSLGPPFILSSSSSLSSSSFITSLFVWKKEGRVVVVWSAKQKHLEYRCAFRARARPTTGIITTREKGREKMVKKKRDFIFSKIFY